MLLFSFVTLTILATAVAVCATIRRNYPLLIGVLASASLHSVVFLHTGCEPKPKPVAPAHYTFRMDMAPIIWDGPEGPDDPVPVGRHRCSMRLPKITAPRSIAINPIPMGSVPSIVPGTRPTIDWSFFRTPAKFGPRPKST